MNAATLMIHAAQTGEEADALKEFGERLSSAQGMIALVITIIVFTIGIFVTYRHQDDKFAIVLLPLLLPVALLYGWAVWGALNHVVKKPQPLIRLMDDPQVSSLFSGANWVIPVLAALFTMSTLFFLKSMVLKLLYGLSIGALTIVAFLVARQVW